MNCCINCFESNYIKSIILGNRKLGSCDFCGSKNINIYEASELCLFFSGIIEMYEVDNENGKPLDLQIIDDFPDKVFSSLIIDKKAVGSLISEIISDDIETYDSLLKKPVRLGYLNTSYDEEIVQPLFLSWDEFSKEIKTVNRFHFVNRLDLDNLEELFKFFRKEYRKGQKLFRARISEDIKGFEKDKMGNPPSKFARSGRANPRGISYLYLAKDILTSLYEVRTSLFDYVSVGTFRLKEDIKVVSLSRSTYDVFWLSESENLEKAMIHGSFIDRLEEELSKPRRKSDSELDYLPTQYLSELIKSIGFDGIEFKSSLHPNGYNLAIFNPDKFECVDVDVFEIKDTHLDYEKIDS